MTTAITSGITQGQEQARDTQKRHFSRLVEDAVSPKFLESLIEQFCFDKDSLQLVIESPELKAGIQSNLTDLVKRLSDSQLHADKQVPSKYGYLSGYAGSIPIAEQLEILKGFNWGRSIVWELNEIQKQLLISDPKPLGSEGWFAIVFDKIMITHHSEDPSVNQSGPVERVLEMLNVQRNGKVVNYRKGELGPAYYRRTQKSVTMLKILWELQGCPEDIMLIPAQFGIKHAGKAVLRARVVIRGREIELDGYETLQMVLTHKNRLAHCDDLWIDLPGSEYSPGAGGDFWCALYVEFGGGALGFDCGGAGNARGSYGSASGFLPSVPQ